MALHFLPSPTGVLLSSVVLPLMAGSCVAVGYLDGKETTHTLTMSSNREMKQPEERENVKNSHILSTFPLNFSV